MAHNFQIGIDYVLDPTGQTPLPNHVFIDGKDGDDATVDGTDPNTPYKTIIAAQSQGQGKSYVVGTGEYPEFGLLPSSNYFADGFVILINNGTDRLASTNSGGIRLDGFIIDGYISISAGGIKRAYRSINNCIIKNTLYDPDIASGSTGFSNMSNTKYINSVVNIGAAVVGTTIDRCMFINSSFEISNNQNITFSNNHLDDNSSVNFSGTGTKTYIYNNNNGTLLGIPDVNTGNIDLPPLFYGVPSNLEFSVQPDSPLLGSGESGGIIGGVLTGRLLNTDSPEFGAALDPLGNTQFNLGELVKINTANDGIRESLLVDMGKLYNSPIINMAGIIDFINNIPYSNGIINPSHLNIEIRYAGSNQVLTAYKPFKLGERILLDDLGKSTADDSFRWGNTVEQTMRYVQIRVKLPITY